MEIISENLLAGDKIGQQKRQNFTEIFWPRLIELWIAASIVAFVFIRILGSQQGQRVLGLLRNHFQS